MGLVARSPRDFDGSCENVLVGQSDPIPPAVDDAQRELFNLVYCLLDPEFCET